MNTSTSYNFFVTSKPAALKTFFGLMLAVTAVSMVFSPQASAQLFDLAEEEAPIVRRIDIEYVGPVTVSRERILANMRTEVGQPFSQLTVSEDIRNLAATGEVGNVRIFAEPVTNGVRAVVVVQGLTTAREVLIQGNSIVSERRLRREVSTQANRTIRDETLEADRQKLLELYRKRGYADADVDYNVVETDDAAFSNVVFTVTEGTKSLIRSISFEGNTVFSDRELRREIKTSPRNWLSFITRTGNLDEISLDDDVISIREFYQNAGYADAEITDVVRTPASDGRVDLTFVIEEGAKYSVGEIQFAGFRLLETERAATLLGVQTGDTFSPRDIRVGTEAIRDFYGAQGYVDLDVLVETFPGGDQVLNLALSAEEGGVSYVDQVIISGNTRTKDKVLRRELAIAPGEVYDTTAVDTSKRRLQNLGYFERVETYPSETGTEGQKDLNIIVEERRTGSFNFGAGFSSIDNLIGFVELTQGNFDIGNWPGLTGGGQKLRVRAQYGVRRRDFVFSFIEPWVFDYQLQFGIDAYYRDAQFLSDVYDQRTIGGALSLRKPIGEFSSLSLAYRLEKIELFDLDEVVGEEIRLDSGGATQSSVRLGYTYDRRDSATLTRRGLRFDAEAYVMGGFLGGDTQIYGLRAEVSQYFNLPFDTIFLINGEISMVEEWGGDGRVPVFNRLYLGGANNLRGFNFRDVSPRDEFGEPIGGLSLARLTLEYTFPIINRVRGALFYDLGVISNDSFSVSGDVASDVGVGLRMDLPIGPIRLDFGVPIQSQAENDSSGRFNFTVGYQF